MNEQCRETSFGRERRISRLSLTSSASAVVAALIKQGKVEGAEKAAEAVLQIAKRLEEYALGEE